MPERPPDHPACTDSWCAICAVARLLEESPAEPETAVCDWCRGTCPLAELESVITANSGAANICGECYESAGECDHCGGMYPEGRGRGWWDDAEGEEHSLCSITCLHTTSYVCDRCGERRLRHTRCECEGSDSEFVHNYGYTPHLKFWGGTGRVPQPGEVFLGFELEMERSGGTWSAAREVVESLDEMQAYVTEDSSLEDGMELTSHPMTLEFLTRQFDWSGVETLRKDGWRSWEPGTCGFHVHIGRTAFSEAVRGRETDRTTHLWRFCHFILSNERWAKNLSGRLGSAQFTSHDDDFHYSPFDSQTMAGESLAAEASKVLSRKTIRERGYEHRVYPTRGAVNLAPSSTVEVRMFRGTMRVERLLANLEFVHAVHAYTKNLTYGQVARGALTPDLFQGWVRQAERYPHLEVLLRTTKKGRLRTGVSA